MDIKKKNIEEAILNVNVKDILSRASWWCKNDLKSNQ